MHVCVKHSGEAWETLEWFTASRSRLAINDEDFVELVEMEDEYSRSVGDYLKDIVNDDAEWCVRAPSIYEFVC